VGGETAPRSPLFCGISRTAGGSFAAALPGAGPVTTSKSFIASLLLRKPSRWRNFEVAKEDVRNAKAASDRGGFGVYDEMREPRPPEGTSGANKVGFGSRSSSSPRT
jgi:hypothetical protein